MKRLLPFLLLVSCGSPQRAETVLVPPPPNPSQTAATHSIVVLSPPAPSASHDAPAADTAEHVQPLPAFDTPFDRGAAAQMLGRASATLLGCRDPSGPSGSGHVRVTFTPSGQVSRADVDPPFAGTSVGRCIERVFEVIQIPAFVGAPVVVGKSFTLPP